MRKLKKKYPIVLACILSCFVAMTFLGCAEERDTPETPMEKLAGNYRLVSYKGTMNGEQLNLSPPEVRGELNLGQNGGLWRISLTVLNINIISASGIYWVATDTTMTLGDGEPDFYRWDGNDLIMFGAAEGFEFEVVWRK